MYFLIKMCGLCLNLTSERFESIFMKNEENLSYFDKITSYLPELKNIVDTNGNFLICKKCIETVNMIYDYNKKCLYSAKVLTSYIKQLSSCTSNKQTSLNVTINKLNFSTDRKNDDKILDNKCNNPEPQFLNVKIDQAYIDKDLTDSKSEEKNFDNTHDNENVVKNRENNSEHQFRDEAVNNDTEINQIVDIGPTSSEPVQCIDSSSNESAPFDQKSVKTESKTIPKKFNSSATEFPPSSSSSSVNHFTLFGENLTQMQGIENVAVKKEIEDLQPNFEEHYLSGFELSEAEEVQMDDQLGFKMEDVTFENDGTEDDSMMTKLPEKSKEKYFRVYKLYIDWCESNKIGSYTTEETLLQYFEFLKEKYKSSSLWAQYSMLKATMRINDGVDLNEYKNLTIFLKKQHVDYSPRQSTKLTKFDVAEFLLKANDDQYLQTKVILIMGLAGGCSKSELSYLPFSHVIDLGTAFQVQIIDNMAGKCRDIFITKGQIPGINFVDIIRKYIALRPRDCQFDRFFLQYQNMRCKKQPIGVHTMGNVPKVVARFLKLPNPDDYTGLCFKKSTDALNFTPLDNFNQLYR